MSSNYGNMTEKLVTCHLNATIPYNQISKKFLLNDYSGRYSYIIDKIGRIQDFTKPFQLRMEVPVLPKIMIL